MGAGLPEWMLDAKTPTEVTGVPRTPSRIRGWGVDVPATAEGTPRRRLVAIGDSLTHGFQSSTIYNTEVSYPAIIAHAMGWYGHFRQPNYFGEGGLLLNLALFGRILL
jgi:hypothetical protein